MTRILITGTTGLIGGAIFDHIMPTGNYDVRGISSKDANLSDQNLNETFGHYDVVIHCAAALPFYCSDNESAIITRKIDQSVFHYCKSINARCIYLSSAYIYDLTTPHAKTENAPLSPPSEYHKAKLDGEKLFSRLGEHVILRVSSPYGKSIKSPTVLNNFCQAAATGTQINVIDRGQQIQDFIHAYDIATLAQAIINNWHSGTYNAVNGQSVSIIELAKICISHSSKSTINFSNTENKISNTLYPIFSNAKAQSTFGWQPTQTLNSSIKDIIDDRQ